MSDGGAQAKYLFLGSDFPGFTINFYAAGTLTGKNVWVDENKSSAIQQVSADAHGMAFWFADGDYRMIVKDADGTQLWDWDKVKITSDSATMWEGNFGTSYPTASTFNRWQMFSKIDASNNFMELGINQGSSFFRIAPYTVIADGFGAKGDGATVCTTALQNAIDSLSAGVVALVDGTYLSDGITLKANVYLYIAGGATLKQKGTGADSLINIEDVSNTGVFGEGTVDGNSALSGTFNAHCIRIYAGTEDVKNIVIKDITIKNCTATATASGDAVNIGSDSAGTYKAKFIKILNTHIADTDRNGITIRGYVENSEIKGNSIESVNTVGIDIEQLYDTEIPNNNVITNNTIYGGQRGIDVMGQDNLITGNTIKGTSSHGIMFAGHATKVDKRNTVSNNIIDSPGNNGIHIDGNCMGWNRVLDNQIYMASLGGHGIRIETGDSNKYNEIAGNTIIDCQGAATYGIELQIGGAGYQTIAGNTIIKDAGGFTSAMHLHSVGNNTVLNNKFIGSFTNEILGIAGTDSIRQIDRIIAKTANFNVETWQTGSTFTNNGATEIITAALPTLIKGITYTFMNTEATALRVDPTASQFIGTCGQGKYISLDTGETLTIKGIVEGSNYWRIVSSNGTLDCEA